MRLSMSESDIDKEQALKFLGYGTKKPPTIILKKTEEVLAAAPGIMEAEVFTKKVSVEVSGCKVTIDGKYEVESCYLSEELKGACFAYVAIYTAGNRIEEAIKEYSASAEMTKGMILDKIGVVALDWVNQKTKEIISEDIGELKISSEVYPSQGDFDISNQQLIFDILEEKSGTISINRYSQFTPIKTVAVIFGIGEAEIEYTRCERCSESCKI